MKILELKKFDKTQRLNLIDEIRGFLIICMVVYHALYSISYCFYSPVFNDMFSFFSPVQPVFAAMFIFISGFCCVLSRSNFIRGFKLFIIALLITLVTAVFLPEQIIVFGILHMLSISMMLYDVLKPIILKIPEVIGIILCVFFFVLTFNISMGKIGPFLLPRGVYKINWLFPIGICGYKFYSADYFSLFPWMFIFFLGSFIGLIGIKNGFFKCMYKKRCKILSIIGKHTLLIYIAHQPIIYVIIWFVKLFK